ncbi:MAG TPA: hypothetical protein K8W13_04085 [Enterococcus columbae]|nr:hypothetical protein [Enterococcus columbae]
MKREVLISFLTILLFELMVTAGIYNSIQVKSRWFVLVMMLLLVICTLLQWFRIVRFINKNENKR